MEKRTLILVLLLLAVSLSFIYPAAYATEYDPALPVVTKNPTSEALNVGGKTWFIAHAENANSLTWLMVDPLGNQYSLDGTMALMSGLSLDALEGDTLAVSNVPAELNGWGITARFDNDAGYRMTEPAYIFVGDFLTAYSSAIELYRSGKQLSVATGANTLEYGISEMANYYQSVGYALKDLDKNGIPELIVAGIDSEIYSTDPFFEIFTLENNLPVSIIRSYPRVRYYLMRDNRILLEGSGGASNSSIELYQVNGSRLQFIEGYMTDYDFEVEQAIMFYSSKWNGTAEEFGLYGDYNSPDYTFPMGEDFSAFLSIQSDLEAQTWIPYLTKII